jgi:hypothetical protein
MKTADGMYTYLSVLRMKVEDNVETLDLCPENKIEY